MIQINLIPDVKREYLKAQRTRNMAISLAILVGLAAVGLTVLLSVVLGGQLLLDAQAKGNIKEGYTKLSAVEDLSNILTIQNQLSKIPEQHANSSRNSRLFGVVSAINPAEPNEVTFNSIKLNPETKSVRLEGSANGGYTAVEVLKKTIEVTKFEYADEMSQNKQTVNLATKVSIDNTSFGEDNGGTKILRFTISFTYNDALFSNRSTNARIVSPTQRIDVTDSKVRVPESLFRAVKENSEN